MSLLMKVGYVLVGWIAGLILYHAGSVAIGLMLPGQRGDDIARYHWGESMRMFGRCVARVHGRANATLLPSSPDSSKGGGEKIVVNGNQKNVDDNGGFMSYVHNRPFGISIKGTEGLIDPLTAAAGRVKTQYVDDNNWWRNLDDQDDLDENYDMNHPGTISEHLPTPTIPRGETLSNAESLLGSGAPEEAVDVSYDYTKKEETVYQKPARMEILILGAMYAAGIGGVFLLDMLTSQSGGGGGSGGTNVGLAMWHLEMILG